MADVPILDLYSGLDHKLGMGDDDSGGLDAAPKWCNDFDRRRLNAYWRIQCYRSNKARIILRDDPLNANKADQWREFGDVDLVLSQQAGSVLGKDPAIEIVGADETVRDHPDFTDPRNPPTRPPATTRWPPSSGTSTR